MLIALLFAVDFFKFVLLTFSLAVINSFFNFSKIIPFSITLLEDDCRVLTLCRLKLFVCILLIDIIIYYNSLKLNCRSHQ